MSVPAPFPNCQIHHLHDGDHGGHAHIRNDHGDVRDHARDGAHDHDDVRARDGAHVHAHDIHSAHHAHGGVRDHDDAHVHVRGIRSAHHAHGGVRDHDDAHGIHSAHHARDHDDVRDDVPWSYIFSLQR